MNRSEQEVSVYKATRFLENETEIFVHRILQDVPSEMHCHNFVELAYVTSGKGMHEIDNSNTLQSILEEMVLERSERRDSYRQMLTASLYRLLISLFRLIHSDTHSKKDSTVYPKLVVESAMAYMRNHCERNLRCQEIAEYAYVSSSYLSLIFKQVTGKTVIAVLQDIRIEKACHMLYESDAPIADIAASCGYADINFFIRSLVSIWALHPMFGASKAAKIPLSLTIS